MALIDCPECEKKISDKATSCPNCGYPLGRERRREAFLLDPLAELAELAEHSVRSLREALERERRRGGKEEEAEKPRDGEEKGPE